MVMKFPYLVVFLFLIAYGMTACERQEMPAAPGSIAGSVFCDQDQDGNCDCEEAGLGNIKVQIFTDHCGGTALQSVSTDDEGRFTFHDVEPGVYFIRVDLEYVCGGRVPTTVNCRQTELKPGQIVTLSPIGFSEYGQ
jgi:hypothetical protein